MKQQQWDAIIIGAGPAGLSAAQALGRSLRRTIVIDAGSPRNRFAAYMHNILGADGIPPEELAARGRAEAAAYGVEFIAATVRRVSDGDGGVGGHDLVDGNSSDGDSVTVGQTHPGVIVEIEDGAGNHTQLEGRALIIATGVTDVLPEIPGLAGFWGRGVLHCPYCHGWEVRGRRLGVIATSPLAMHQIKLLRQWSDHLVAFTAGLGSLSAEDQFALEARGIVIDSDPVTEVRGDDDGLTAVLTARGTEHAIDAVFTMGKMVPQDGCLAELSLDRSETPMGSFLAVDMMKCTSHPRIWAAGNVANPSASVPIVMGDGAFAGAAVNAVLVEEDFAIAIAQVEAVVATVGGSGSQFASESGSEHEPEPEPLEPTEFWDQRYANSDQMWSGAVNSSIARAVR